MFGVELPVAVVTVDGGAVVVPVVEVEPGVFVDRVSGVPVDLLDVVVVLGLPDLEPAAA